MLFFFNSCQTDSENINEANENTALTTKNGLLEATTGLKLLYSTTGLSFLITSTTTATKEAGTLNTLVALRQLEDGGQNMPNDNPTITGLWGTMLRVLKNSDEIIEATNKVPLVPGTKSGIVAYAKIYKALSIGTLCQNFEKVVTQTNLNNNAQFVSRQQGFLYAIQLLNEAKSDIVSNPVTPEITSLWNSEVNLVNTLNALIARYSLFAGNYTDAISAANLVSLTTKSVFKYDSRNLNPVFVNSVQANNSRPVANFGLSSTLFPVAATDGRRAFYLTVPGVVPVSLYGNYPLNLLTGFFGTATSDIPVYLVDEMKLIKAEAHLRKASPDLSAATLELNSVLTGTDVFGVNANLPAYSGPNTVTDLLLEVYRNRRIELFFSGMSLEDSRRFGRPNPTIGPLFYYTDERNRNFYPYPFTERSNNPNTPADPSI